MYALIQTGRATRGEKALVFKFKRKKHTPEQASAAAAPRETSGDRGLGRGGGRPPWGAPREITKQSQASDLESVT